MYKTKFNKCLNIEPKLYNFSISSLVGAGVAGLVGAFIWGFLGFFILFGAGFYLGKKAGEGWWSGSIQRYMYWNLPAFFTLGVIGKTKSVPPSHIRRLF